MSSMRLIALLTALALVAPAVARVEPPPSDPGDPDRIPVEDDPRFGLLTPLPEEGQVPPIVSRMSELTDREMAWRAAARRYARQIQIIKHNHFGTKRVETIRQAGIERLREFTDPAAFRPMLEVLAYENDDVRLAVLDHLGKQGASGQAALMWVAIHDHDHAIRNEAGARLVAPPPDDALVVLDRALRSPDHGVANAAGTLAGTLNVLDAIPLMIFAQAAPTGTAGGEGDLAWIAIQTQRAFVSDLVPVVGDSSGGFMPILSTVTDGSVLRVIDAVVIVYRTQIHTSLVNMTSYDWGQSTAHLGYDMDAWWSWYNDEYVPYKNDQARLAELGEAPPTEPDPDAMP